MKRCERCGSLNIEAVCAECGASLLTHGTNRAPRPSTAPHAIRSGLVLITFGSVAVLILALAFVRANTQFKLGADRLSAVAAASEVEHRQSVDRETQERGAEVGASEAKHLATLRDVDLISGRTAQRAHQEEWSRRLAHEPSLATSALETNLLYMERVGADPAIAAREALRKVALLASPPGSRVDVTPAGAGFNVRVAFKLSALAQNETGMVTKHHSTSALRREIESLSLGLVKQLFDYCGSRGIEKLSVSCNRAVLSSPVPEGATEAQRDNLVATGELIMRSLYRISIHSSAARTVENWRAASDSRVLSLVALEKDGLRDLKITKEGFREASDPNMPLEF